MGGRGGMAGIVKRLCTGGGYYRACWKAAAGLGEFVKERERKEMKKEKDGVIRRSWKCVHIAEVVLQKENIG